MTIIKPGTLPPDRQPYGLELEAECPCCETQFRFFESEGLLTVRSGSPLYQVECPLLGCGWKVEVAA